jgi:glutaredoxin/glutathione-dependent peroxiredoxin
MTIKVGDSVPKATIKRTTADGATDIDTSEYFKGRTVVVFGLPGAFTPTCSAEHLPGYVAKADELKAQGVDEIACLSVNDAFVMRAWGKEHGADGKVTMLADGNAAFVRALGLEQDLSVAGMGVRAKRFSFVVQDGVIKSLQVESGKGVSVSGADQCLLGVR